MKKNSMTAAEFRSLTSKSSSSVTFAGHGPGQTIAIPVNHKTTGEQLSRQEIRELTIKKKKNHEKISLSAEEACTSMGKYFELDEKKVNYFIRQLQITGHIATVLIISILFSSCRPYFNQSKTVPPPAKHTKTAFR